MIWFVPTLCTVPINWPSTEVGCPAEGDGNCERLTPLGAEKFTVRSDWITVFRLMSSDKARGELAVRVIGDGEEEKVNVRGVVAGVSWQMVLLAQPPMAAPVLL